MATYATPQDVLDRYEGTASTGTVQKHLDDAERKLLGDLRRAGVDLVARVDAGDVDAADVEYVLASAVIRYLRNPEGYTFESAGDRSVSRGSNAGAGRIAFLPDELAQFMSAAARGLGWGTVRTPRVGPVPARYGYVDGTLL